MIPPNKEVDLEKPYILKVPFWTDFFCDWYVTGYCHDGLRITDGLPKGAKLMKVDLEMWDSRAYFYFLIHGELRDQLNRENGHAPPLPVVEKAITIEQRTPVDRPKPSREAA